MEFHYDTLAECQAAMNTLTQVVGKENIPEGIIAEYKRLKALPQRGVVAKGETPIYTTLVNNYPYGEMPEEKKLCIETTVEKLLEEGPHAEEPGLLLGKIQCGKTDTFEDIIGLAFDRGIDIAIILTKGTNPLALQTLMRLRKDFALFKDNGDLDQVATIYIEDIMNVWRKLRRNVVENNKCVFVCKKENTNLRHLIEMFERNRDFLCDKRVLIVDDEADFASRNYRMVRMQAEVDQYGFPVEKERETELAVISQRIDQFRKIPSYCRYLQVTATPYCLYLQPQGQLNLNGRVVKPFRPRFTSLVPVHDAYIGGQQYFEDSKDPQSMYSHLFHPVSDKCLRVLAHEDKRYLNNTVSSANLYDFTYALVSYFVATAIRRIQVRTTEHRDYKTSALLHIELSRRYHEWQSKVAKHAIENIVEALVDDSQEDQRVWKAVDDSYEDFLTSNTKAREQKLIDVEVPNKEAVLEELRNILDPANHNYVVQVVNIDNDVVTLLDQESGELKLEVAANIFIGGSILDRGITIKNMLCFFYGRNPKNFQQDTVLQHARMYGARSKEDMAVTRFHTSTSIYHILSRMNELDNQLREWFLAGNDQLQGDAVFVGFDKHIKPCAMQKIKASDTLTLKQQMRLLPVGFFTKASRDMKKPMAELDRLIAHSMKGQTLDPDGIYRMDKDTAMQILELIESTYVYNLEKYGNANYKNDLKEMRCALEYCTEQSGGMLYALHRTDRNMSRVRANGGYIDAPDDGRTDLLPAREKAQHAPVLMLLKENGRKEMVDGVNIGWNNAPFYWPVLITQASLQPVIYALDQRRKSTVTPVDLSDVFKGIDDKDVLKLTYAGKLVEHFGEEGTVYPEEGEPGQDYPIETRLLKESTFAYYVEKDERGMPRINPAVQFDQEHDHGVFSLNDGTFPFILRPYKYLFLRNGYNADSDLMLLELMPMSKWRTAVWNEVDDDGNLYDDNGKDVLVYGNDVIYDKNMNETEFEDPHLALWAVQYAVKRVVKHITFKKQMEEEEMEE